MKVKQNVARWSRTLSRLRKMRSRDGSRSRYCENPRSRAPVFRLKAVLFGKMSDTMRTGVLAASVLVCFLAPGCSKPSATPAPGAGRGGPVPVNVGETVQKDVPIDLAAIGNVEPVATVGIKA